MGVRPFERGSIGAIPSLTEIKIKSPLPHTLIRLASKQRGCSDLPPPSPTACSSGSRAFALPPSPAALRASLPTSLTCVLGMTINVKHNFI
jgi:hypothetical protein